MKDSEAIAPVLVINNGSPTGPPVVPISGCGHLTRYIIHEFYSYSPFNRKGELILVRF